MSRPAARAAFAAIALLATAPAVASRRAGLDGTAIVKRSVDANRRDWNAAPGFDYVERDRTGTGTKTYHVVMLLGSPYLVPIEGTGSTETAREQQLIAAETARRNAESPDRRAARIDKYRKERERDRVMLQQLTEAFDFTLRGRARKNGRSVYVVDATPRAGYSPPNAHAKALTGMRGTLWIDTATFNWVEVSAAVVHPVSIAGFLATVEPGTAFELEKMPVDGDIWMPSHFSQRARARVLLVFPHDSREDLRYWDYARATPAGR